MKDIRRETRNILIDKLIKAFEVDSKDVADYVELYYDSQKLRIMHANKEKTEGAGELKSWFAHWLDLGEKVLTSKLKGWVLSDKAPREAQWAYSQIGIGPIIASGLAAYINPEKAPSISSVWKYAGLAPGYDRKVKGQKLAYNARLKLLTWKMGESFVKVSGKEGAVYGELYSQFKNNEIERNENGLYKAQAARELSIKKFKDDTETRKRLEEGKLSDAHLHARAKRRTVKMFLSHYWLVARKDRGLPITEPYAIAILGHDGKIEPR